MAGRARLWTGLLLLTLPAQAALPRPAAAHPPAATSADPRAAELFRAGREAMAREEFAVACAKFEASARIEPAPGTLLNLALCQESLGQIGRALENYRAVIGLLPASDERVPFAKEHAAALESRAARLTVVVAPTAPPDARVLRNGEELPPDLLGVESPVDPGAHTLTLEVAGQQPVRVTVTLAEGERRTLNLEPPPPPPPPEPDRPAPMGTRTKVGLIVGGVGAASLAVGLVAGAMVLDKKATVEQLCDERVCTAQEGIDAARAGRTLSTISTITFLAGVAGLGAGVYLVLTDDGDAAPAAGSAAGQAMARGAATALAPALLPGGGGLSVWRRF